MKLKKVASICSKTKIFCLYDREESGGEVSQWLGDSSAIYPITGLPYMDEEKGRFSGFCKMFSGHILKKEQPW